MLGYGVKQQLQVERGVLVAGALPGNHGVALQSRLSVYDVVHWLAGRTELEGVLLRDFRHAGVYQQVRRVQHHDVVQ